MKAALRKTLSEYRPPQNFAAAEKELGYCRRNSIAAIADRPRIPALLREIPIIPIYYT